MKSPEQKRRERKIAQELLALCEDNKDIAARVGLLTLQGMSLATIKKVINHVSKAQ